MSASGHVILLLWYPNICVRLWADISSTAPSGFKRPITVGKVDWVVNGVCIFICELTYVRRGQRKMSNILFCHHLPYSLETESLPKSWSSPSLTKMSGQQAPALGQQALMSGHTRLFMEVGSRGPEFRSSSFHSKHPSSLSPVPSLSLLKDTTVRILAVIPK